MAEGGGLRSVCFIFYGISAAGTAEVWPIDGKQYKKWRNQSASFFFEGPVAFCQFGGTDDSVQTGISCVWPGIAGIPVVTND